MSYADRLVMRWQDASDDAEKDIIFSRLVHHCMRLPVVKRARRQTFSGVASHSPRFADEEEQAIRRAIWRAAKKFDRGRGVEFDAYVSRGLKVAIHDFWRQEAWIEDLQMHVPVAEWKRYRQLVSERPDGAGGRPAGCPIDLWNACTPLSWCSDADVELVTCDEYDFEEEWV